MSMRDKIERAVFGASAAEAVEMRVKLAELRVEQKIIDALDQETYIGDWCADPGLSHELCTNGACECPCHGEHSDREPPNQSDA